MNTTSIISWYKKVNSLMYKNINIITRRNFSIDIGFMDIDSNTTSKSITICIFDHNKENGNSIVFKNDICDYNDEKINRKVFKQLKEFLETFNT